MYTMRERLQCLHDTIRTVVTDLFMGKRVLSAVRFSQKREDNKILKTV